jgi:hypothetical protein
MLRRREIRSTSRAGSRKGRRGDERRGDAAASCSWCYSDEASHDEMVAEAIERLVTSRQLRLVAGNSTT